MARAKGRRTTRTRNKKLDSDDKKVTRLDDVSTSSREEGEEFNGEKGDSNPAATGVFLCGLSYAQTLLE